MDLIIENGGLDLIGIKIFGYLSPEDTFKCCFVSKSWHHFIIENKKRIDCTINGTSNLEGIVKRLLQCTCPYHSCCLDRFNRPDCWKCKSTPADCFKACILLEVFNIEDLLLNAVIKGCVEFFEFLLPYAKIEGIDFDLPLPTIQEEPYKKRPLLHNLVCTEHCNRKILAILLNKLCVDVFGKDGNGCKAIDLAISQIPMDIRVTKGLSTLRSNFDVTYHQKYDDEQKCKYIDDEDSLRAERWLTKALYYYSDYLETKEDAFLTLIRNKIRLYM